MKLIIRTAQALLDFGMNTNLLELNSLTIYGYIWVLNDLVSDALKLNDEALSFLSKIYDSNWQSYK